LHGDAQPARERVDRCDVSDDGEELDMLDDEIMPFQERSETVGDDAGLQEVYDTERHLLYVACTRARDHLLVTGVDPVSEFLDDIIKGD